MSQTEVSELTEVENEIVRLLGKDTSHTMYKVANTMSEVLGTRVREQMLYNYRSKGLIKVVDGKATTQTVVEFIIKRWKKNNQK